MIVEWQIAAVSAASRMANTTKQILFTTAVPLDFIYKGNWQDD